MGVLVMGFFLPYLPGRFFATSGAHTVKSFVLLLNLAVANHLKVSSSLARSENDLLDCIHEIVELL